MHILFGRLYISWYTRRLGSILQIKETLPDSELFKAELSFHHNRNIIKVNSTSEMIVNGYISVYYTAARLEKLQQADVQLSERLRFLGIIWGPN